MSYIRNISKLATRRLSKLSHYILEQSNIDMDDMMIQSAVVKESQNKNYTQNILDMVRNGDNISFVTYKQRCCSNFWCNIQQIKKKYNGVLFVMYYKTSVAIYCIPKEEYKSLCRISNISTLVILTSIKFYYKFITNKNIEQLDKYLLNVVKYKDIFD